MCASCGCGEANEKHGDSANITRADLENAANAADITPEQAAQNILESVNS